MHSPCGGGSYLTAVTPVVQVPARHPFDDQVDELLPQTGGSRSAAMVQARLLYPALFQSYQRWSSGGSAQAQQTAQGETSDQFNKLGRATFEQAVAKEMTRGCNETVAGQRVLQAHGYRALDKRDTFIAKGLAASAAVEDKFYKAAGDVILRDGLDSRMEGLRRARLENPKLWRALQSL